MRILDIKNAIINVIKEILALPPDFEVNFEIPPDSQLGDLSVSCFKMASYLKRSPNEIAEILALKLDPKIGARRLFNKAESAGPYVNFFFDKAVWFEVICQQILELKDSFGGSSEGAGKKILIESSAPNTNKPQHLGHLRNNFLGWAIANLFSFTGFKVIRTNLINDRGIHICKSMLAYQKWGKDKTPETENVKGDHFVGKYYVLFAQKEKKNPELLEEAQKMMEKWEQGDTETIALWQKMNKWALDGFNETYKKTGISFDYVYYESDVYNLGKKIILKALKNGLCYKREDGAVEIDLTKDGLDKKVLIRADGTSVYVTQDIGLANLRYKEFKADKTIYVVASEQDYHFKVLFRVLEIFGFDWVKSYYHLSYGMVFLPHGRMKSREGQVVEADDIIFEMKQLAKSELLKRNPHLSPCEVSKRAEIIALAALKFFFLKFTPTQDIHFNPQESLSFEGDTGPYLQYVYARIRSILRKSGIDEMARLEVDYSILGSPEETEILKLLFMFSEAVNKAANQRNPACLANHILKLAQKFNEFYHQQPVLKAESGLRNARLVLIAGVAQVIKLGLDLLGIDVLEEM